MNLEINARLLLKDQECEVGMHKSPALRALTLMDALLRASDASVLRAPDVLALVVHAAQIPACPQACSAHIGSLKKAITRNTCRRRQFPLAQTSKKEVDGDRCIYPLCDMRCEREVEEIRSSSREG